jgi:hypothetical protein
MKPNQTKYLRTKEAAEYLQRTYGYGSASLLDRVASEGTGPPCHRFGSGHNRLYKQSALDRWAVGGKEAAE